MDSSEIHARSSIVMGWFPMSLSAKGCGVSYGEKPSSVSRGTSATVHEDGMGGWDHGSGEGDDGLWGGSHAGGIQDDSAVVVRTTVMTFVFSQQSAAWLLS